MYKYLFKFLLSLFWAIYFEVELLDHMGILFNFLRCCHTIFYSGCTIFWLYHATCGILVPQPGIKPGPLAVRALSPNHWTTREFPWLHHFKFPPAMHKGSDFSTSSLTLVIFFFFLFLIIAILKDVKWYLNVCFFL